MPLVPTTVCPVLIEREVELAILRGALDEARGGSFRFVSITGEAGVGKSRLLSELAREAAASGWRILLGQCSERDRDYPFAPLIDALQQQRRARDPLPHVGERIASLSWLLPELAGPAVAAHATPLAPEQSKRQTFEAIAMLLSEWATGQPLLVAFEDLHWADPTSLELLELLPRRLATEPVIMLGTARSDELSEPLRHTLATLRRRRQLVELRLERLDRHGVGQMLAAMLTRPPAPAWTATLHERTGGNPFFVEELLSTVPHDAAGWNFGAQPVPATVRDTVVERLVGLDTTCVELAELAAVIGPRFQYELLAQISGHADDSVSSALDELCERQILVEEHAASEPSYAFRHALTRDAIHDRLTARQRRRLHQLVGEALEAAATAQRAQAGELGYHFALAGDWERALRYAQQAGDSAHRLHATPEALTHYQRARDAALALNAPETGALQLRCGRALGLLGAHDAARAQLEQACAFAQAHGDRTLEQAACYELAGLYASHDYRRAQELATQALTLAHELDDPRQVGLALNRLGNVLTNLGRFDESLPLHQQALARFEAHADRWGIADALDLIGMTHYLAGEVIEARQALGDASNVFAELDDPERLASALTTRGLYIAVLDGPCAIDATPDAFRADAERGLQICQAIAWRSGEAYAQVALANAALGAGHFATALGHLDQALAIAAEIDHPQWTVIARMTRGLLFVELCDDQQAHAEFTAAFELASALGSTQWRERAQGWSARCRLRLSAADGVEQVLTPLVLSEGAPRSLAARRALCTLAELALARGDGNVALALIDRFLAADDPEHAPPAALLIRASALASLSRPNEADAELERARRNAQTAGQRLLYWRIAAARSQLWHARNPALSRGEAEIARHELTALAAEISDDRQRERFLAAPEVQRWLRASARSRTARSDGPGGLTARELDVAREVVAGRSNREIAARLSISERTVEMHVSNALGKLGFATRAQLAAWAASHAQPDDPSAR